MGWSRFTCGAAPGNQRSRPRDQRGVAPPAVLHNANIADQHFHALPQRIARDFAVFYISLFEKETPYGSDHA